MKYTHITELIGKTPLLRIDEGVHGIQNLTLYAKLEYMNPFGSVKDRAVWGMLRDDLPDLQHTGATIVEMSSGNTAKAIQGIAGTYGVPFKTITNRIKVDEVRDILLLQGAHVGELPGNSDCHDPNDPNDPLVYIHRELEKYPQQRFFTSQYNNEKNLDEHYRTTGEEIVRDLEQVDYYFAGLGTTGSSRGPAMKIKERDAHLHVSGVVASKNDYIPGIRTIDEIYEVGLLDPTFYNDIIPIDSAQAIDGMISLIRSSGIMSGPTGGAVYSALLSYFKSNPPTQPVTAVFIVCDRAEWYVSYVKKRRPELFGKPEKQSWKTRVAAPSKSDECVISAATLHASLTDKKDVLIVDTRNPLAFRAAHLPESMNVPFEYIDDMLDHNTNPFCFKKTVIFVCPIGEKSLLTATHLRAKGVEAYSLEGGITAWRDSGFPMESDL